MSDIIISEIIDGDPDTAWVAIFPFELAIVAHFNGLTWEPMYSVRKGGGRSELPSCFELADDLLSALTTAREAGSNQ